MNFAAKLINALKNIVLQKPLFARVALFLLISIPFIAYAQPDKLGSWNILSATINPNNKFSYWFETQTRSQNVIKDFYYYELKGGAAYNLSDKTQFFFGMGDYKTFSYPGNFKKPVATNEFRMWEQFTLKSNIDRVKIEHRYRIEQRWINGMYRNRFRYRINPVIPLNHSKVIPKTLYLNAFDEIFFTNRSPYFERNRFFVGAGYQFTGLFALQTGFIRQFDYNTINNGVGKNFIQTTFLFYIDKNTLNLNIERKPNLID